MKIIRDGKEYALTRQELFEASEAYQYEPAKEIVSERAKTKIGADVPDTVIDVGIAAYLILKDSGHSEEACLSEAMDIIRDTNTVVS